MELAYLLLIAPFYFLITWTIALAREKQDARIAWAFFTITMALLLWIYGVGYMRHRDYMEQKMWTAASMSLASIMFKSIPVVLVAWGARWLIFAKASDREQGKKPDG